MSLDLASCRPLCTWHGDISPDWVDYNGHLRDAYYLLIFSFASDGLMNHIGLDEAGRRATGHSLFTMECHLNFLHEVKAGTVVEVHTQILGHDKKRLHISQSLQRQGSNSSVAVNEVMLLNVDMAGPSSAEFAPCVLPRIEQLANFHAGLPKPEFTGRVIRLPGLS